MKSQPVPPHQMSDPPGRLTALSRSMWREGRKFGHLSLVARTSLGLGLIAALGGLSCLVTTSPEFTKPERTPPFLTSITPPTWQVLRLLPIPGTPGTYLTPELRFDVVSEDLQNKLQAILFWDFKGFEVPYELIPTVLLSIQPGHFPALPNEPDRETVIVPPQTFPANIGRSGCHSVTLAVSHAWIQPPATMILKPVDPLHDVATVTWWYDLADDKAPPTQLNACVTGRPETGDAGSDAADGGAQ